MFRACQCESARAIHGSWAPNLWMRGENPAGAKTLSRKSVELGLRPVRVSPRTRISGKIFLIAEYVMGYPSWSLAAQDPTEKIRTCRQIAVGRSTFRNQCQKKETGHKLEPTVVTAEISKILKDQHKLNPCYRYIQRLNLGKTRICIANSVK